MPVSVAVQKLNEIAAYLQPQMRRALTKALAHVRDTADLDAIATALDEKDFYAAAREMMAGQPAAEASLRAAFSDALAIAGRQYITAANDALGNRLQFQFAVGTPESVAALDRLSLQFFPDIFKDSETVLRAVFADGLRLGDNPVTVARDARAFVGFTQYDYNLVSQFQNKLLGDPAAALDNQLRDARFDATLKRAARGDLALTTEQVDTMTQRYSDRLLAWRSETWSRTATLNSVREGQLVSWQDAGRAAGVDPATDMTKTWVTTLDGRERPSHHDMDGVTVGLNETWDVEDDGDVQTPGENAYNCRCTFTVGVVPLNQRDD